MFAIDYEGPYDITGPSPVLENAFEGTFSFDQKSLTLQTDDIDAIASLGFESCDLSLNKKVDVSAEGCSFIESIEECQADYDVISIEDRFLYPGKRTDSMCDPSGRPTERGFQMGAAQPLEVVAEFQNGDFLENGDIADDGTLYFTNYFEKALYAYKANNEVEEVAQLPAHPVAVLVLPQGFLISAHNIPFTESPDEFTASNQLLQLTTDGSVQEVITVPDARFLNGMTQLPDERYLIADSIAATLWVFDPEDGSVSSWLQDELLAQDPSVEEFRPGANGIKVVDNTLLISNSSRGTLMKLPLTGSMPDGVPSVFADTGPIDDFMVAIDGTIYATTHAEAVLSIDPNGNVSNVIESGCDGCTAVFSDPASPSGDELLFLTTGNFLEGGQEPANIVRLYLERI